MDEDGDGTLTSEECFHFVHLCFRTGALHDTPQVPASCLRCSSSFPNLTPIEDTHRLASALWVVVGPRFDAIWGAGAVTGGDLWLGVSRAKRAGCLCTLDKLGVVQGRLKRSDLLAAVAVEGSGLVVRRI
jgi:hypothetical protein